MKRFAIKSMMVFFMSAFGAFGVFAQNAGELSFSKMWVRASPPAARVAGAYLEIVNNGPEDDLLVSVSFAGAGRSAVHTMNMVDGIMKMRPIKGGVVVSSGSFVKFRPGGNHLMLMGLKAPVVKGSIVKITLEFKGRELLLLNFL